MASDLAWEAVAYKTEVGEATALDATQKKLFEEAERLLAEGKADEGLRKALDALATLSVHFTREACKPARDRAQKTVNKAIAYFQSTSDQYGEAFATKASARIQVTKNRPEGAKKTATQAAALFRTKGDKKNEASSMVTVVDAHLSKAALVGQPGHTRMIANVTKTQKQVEEDNKVEALRFQEDAMNAAREVAELFRQANDKRGQADMLCALADINNNMSEFERAKEVCMMARDLYLDLDDRKGAQKALELEHDAHIKSLDGEEALNAAQEMVKMYRQAGDKRGEAEGMFLVMKTHFQFGACEELMKVGKEARGVCQKASDVEMEGIILDSMMKAQMFIENDEEALKLADEAVEVFKKGGHKKGEAAALHAAAGIMLDKFFKDSDKNVSAWRASGFNASIFKDYDMESYDKALGMVKEAEDIYTALNDKEGLALILDTQQNVTIRATMLQEPDETKQIIKDNKPLEIIHTWYIPDPEDAAAAALADKGEE
uniref:Uncharacterized protein n=1 Tax=Alexandrium catenella TaxID=2925 RepID=A0A7S1RMQ5_ALECA